MTKDVDKLRKIAVALWLMKERIVFAIMVMVLFWHAYSVFFGGSTASSKAKKQHTAPRAELPPDAIPDINSPMDATPTPSAGDWAAIYTPNPFWYQGGASKPSSATTVTASGRTQAAPPIKLVRISGGRAQLQAEGASPQWASEGGTVGGYQVTKIDADNKTCEVISEQDGKGFTLRIGEG